MDPRPIPYTVPSNIQYSYTSTVLIAPTEWVVKCISYFLYILLTTLIRMTVAVGSRDIRGFTDYVCQHLYRYKCIGFSSTSTFTSCRESGTEDWVTLVQPRMKRLAAGLNLPLCWLQFGSSEGKVPFLSTYNCYSCSMIICWKNKRY